MDIRVLELLIRIATRKQDEDERGLKTASEVIEFVKNYYQHVDFNYLTPSYILDWYSALGKRGFYVLEPVETERRDALWKSDPSEPLLVQLPQPAWRELILTPRLERLLLTGYEDI